MTKQNAIIKWLTSPLGQYALGEVRKQFPNFSSNPITHISFTLGRYADEFSQADLDAADPNALMKAVYGFTYDEAQAERGRKGGQASSDAKAEAARRNGAKGGRPRKPKE